MGNSYRALVVNTGRYKPQDISGQTFGQLMAVKCIERDKKEGYRWLCKCICGNHTTAFVSRLRDGEASSCGCTFRKKNSRKGKRFGSLVVIKRVGVIPRRGWIWLCRCDCGIFIEVLTTHLKISRKTSCGIHTITTWEDTKARLLTCLFRADETSEIAKQFKVTPRTIKSWITKLAKELGIDSKRYIVQVRIIYLVSRMREQNEKSINAPPSDSILCSSASSDISSMSHASSSL